jgi:carbon-monoxide dehydrogenase medium subunit
VGILDHFGQEGKAVAGATAVVLLLRQRLIAPRALVSLGKLPGLRDIRGVNGSLHLGALATHREVELSPLVRQHLPVLAHTFGKVANVRVRNAATVGGVLAEADYASDPPALLLALDAVVEVRGPGRERVIPVGEFIRGFYETALEPGEIVTGVRVPLPPAGTGALYEKYITRSSEDRPCLGVAAIASLDPASGRCTDLRVAVGAASETPRRVAEAEALARDQELTEDVARAIAEQYANSVDTLDDFRGSSWYRTEMLRVWVRRCILQARDAARSR